MVKRKTLLLSLTALLAAGLSCDKSPTGPDTGSIAFVLVTSGGQKIAVREPGSAPNQGVQLEPIDGVANVTLDGVTVTVTGPTTKTVSNATILNGFIDITVSDLDVGAYSAVVQGTVGGEVVYMAQVSGITVTSGQTTTAQANFNRFQPDINALVVPDTTDVLHFNVSFDAVTGASGYVVAWSQSPTMSGAQTASITSTSTDVQVSSEATYYVTVRATNGTLTSKATDPLSVFVFQGVATVTVTPGTPSIAYGATQQFAADGKDSDGNTVANVTWLWVSSNSNVATVSQTGLATAVGPGTATITAVGKGLPGSATLTVTNPPATKLVFTSQPGNATSATSLGSVKVSAQNVLNQTVTTGAAEGTQVAITIGTNAGGGALGGTATATIASGVASFNNLTIDKAGTGYTLSAAPTTGSLTATASSAFNITPGAASQLVFGIQPSNTIAADVISPAVQVEERDAAGNLVTTARDAITIAIGTNPSTGTLAGAKTVNAIAGIASFPSLNIDKAGTGYTLTASGVGGGTTSSAFNVTSAGAASKLAFVVQPTNAASAANIAPNVQVAIQDAQGRLVDTDNTTQITVAIGTNPNSGTLSGTKTVQVTAGVASFGTLNIDKAGSGYTLTASATSLTGGTSSTFTISPGAPDRLAVVVQPTASTAGDPISPAIQVEVRDAAGNTVTSARNPVTIGFAANPGSGTLTGTKTVNAVGGIASFSGLFVNKAAAGYTLGAVSAGLTGTVSNAFTISAGAAAKLAFLQQPSTVQGNVVMAPNVTVNITDQYDNLTTATNTVTLSLASNPWKTAFATGGTVSATSLSVAAVSGTATFANLRVDKPGIGYALGASATSLTSGTSGAFNVTLAVQPDTNPRTKIAAGGYHTCAIMTSGYTYCWGSNYYGELGAITGNTNTDSIPALVRDGAKPAGQSFVTVANGQYHSCGLTADSTAYCWGNNDLGQLGNNSNTASDLPVLVLGGHKFRSIAAASFNTCAVTGNGGSVAEKLQVYCWGYNGYGQVGDSTSGSNKLVPTRVNWPDAIKKLGGIVSNPDTGVKVLQVTVGGDYDVHVCARIVTGPAYCWGSNYNGQIGINTTGAPVLGPALVLGGYSWTAISAGSYHNCGVTSAGAIRCWGYNGYGQLGDGSQTDRYQPAATPAINVGATGVSAGYYHSCGVTGGTAYCWGYNGNGQLGDNTTTATNANPPVAVTGGLTFTNINAGWFYTCGRTASATYCWGNNGNGQLGSPGTGGNKLQPTQIIQ